MNCAEVTELLAAYALDALPDDERAEVESHLETCDLHAEAFAFDRTAARLAAAAPEREPPPALRDRIAEAAGSQRRTAVPPPAAPVAQPLELSRFRRFAPLALAAAIAVIVIGFVGLNVLDDGDDDSITRTASANGVSTTLVYSTSGASGTVSFKGLPALTSTQAYQLWAIAPDQPPASAGLLDRRDDGTASTAIAGDFEPGTTFAITVEPAGGSDQPTTTPLVATEL